MPKPSALTIACTTTVAALAAVAFSMSFDALTGLAVQAGLSTPVGLPLVIDGAALTGSLAAVMLRRDRRRGVRWYAPSQVALCAALSTLGNALHATGAHLTTVDAAMIGGVPPVMLLLSAHLSLLLTAPGTSPAAKHRTSPQPVPPTSKPTMPAAKSPATATAAAPSGPRAAVIAWAQSVHAATGEFPTGTELSARLGASQRSGYRLLASLRAGNE